MSLNSAMLTGISGLTTNAASLAVISDNIANVNTPAFKRSAAEFSNMIAGSGSRKGIYFGGGVTGTTRQYISQQGNLQRTGQSTDMAIAGNGFFMVAKTSNDPKSADARTFTRYGNFTPDDAGFLKTSSGQYLLGWPVDNTGNIDYDPTDITKLKPINVSSATGTASATTTVAISANLKSSQALSAAATAAAATPVGAGAYNATTNNMSMYAVNANTGVAPDFVMQVPVADSKGGQRNLSISFLRSATPNTWYAELRGTPSDLDTTANPNGLISSGVVKFNSDGSIDMANTTLFGTPGGTTSLTIGASSATSGSRWATNLGVAAQTINFDLSNKFTQTDNVSQLLSTNSNGTAFGNRVSIEVDENGFVSAVFDNGSIRQLAQVAVATFTNPDGLLGASGGLYSASSSSGNYILNTAGSSGVGKIAAAQLEASNVDLSLEFTGLITTQRAYSASSKIITTSDQMLDELISIKR